MDGDDSGWMNSLDFGQRLLKEPGPCRVGWQQRETCCYFQGKGSSDRFWNVGKLPEPLLVHLPEGDPSTGDIPWPQCRNIPIFPLFPGSARGPVLPVPPRALLEAFPADLES